MIVPQYWAEARVQHKQRGRQITLRRFGWSDETQADAQANADRRAQEALEQVLAGKKLERSEPKIPYNGAEGIPIREEIVSRHGDTIITRNSYGARCLNTPDVLFVDIDFPDSPPLRFTFSVFVLLQLCAIAAGYFNHSKFIGIAFAILSLLFFSAVSGELYRLVLKMKGGIERLTSDRIDQFLSKHPDWNLRIYKTPAGMRVLVTHRIFSPAEPEVQQCFDALGADPMYAAMCRNQQCFRARVSPKPWRIGIGDHMRPRPGNWPVAAERMPLRQAWIEKYEAAAKPYAACTFIESKGSCVTHVDVAAVVELHDQMSRADRQLQIA